MNGTDMHKEIHKCLFVKNAGNGLNSQGVNEMDLHAKSQQLLESLSNSLLDRGQPVIHFTTKEVHLIEQFLRDYERDIRNKLAEY